MSTKACLLRPCRSPEKTDSGLISHAGLGKLRRETPVILKGDDGSLVEGVIDLAFQEETPEFAGWTIVDFKTDREFEATSAPYVAQVRMYSDAVAGATGGPVRGVLLVLVL